MGVSYIMSPAMLKIRKYTNIITFCYLEYLSLVVFRFFLGQTQVSNGWRAIRRTHHSFRNLDLEALIGVPFTAAARTFSFTTAGVLISP
jgi:hypothetical protein